MSHNDKVLLDIEADLAEKAVGSVEGDTITKKLQTIYAKLESVTQEGECVNSILF